MISGPSSHAPAVPTRALSAAIAARYAESEAARYGISAEAFAQIVFAVIVRYSAQGDEAEQLTLLATLRVAELALVRACAAGNDAAWTAFLNRYRAPLYEAAYRIARSDATGRELADSLYAELYGLTNDKGRRVCKLDYYTGRGSLEGWLRTVLAQRYVDLHRSHHRDTSLEEQVESGVTFAAPAPSAAPPDARLGRAVALVLAELAPDERFLLAAYFLDQQTLAEIGRVLRVHESTISRKLDRLLQDVRKRVRRKLSATGLTGRQCDELIAELDVRDLQVDVRTNLRQENGPPTFYKEDGAK